MPYATDQNSDCIMEILRKARRKLMARMARDIFERPDLESKIFGKK
jgi:hypothetical protein